MKLSKVVIFASVRSQYGVMDAFEKGIAEAFISQGVDCRILEAEYKNPGKFLQNLLENPPDCTLSFNGLLPDATGNFLCDMIKIPHVAYLLDSPNHFFSLVQSKYTIISCIDKFFCEFFNGLHFNRLLFLPQGIDKNLATQPEEEKKYPIFMLGSFFDYEAIRKRWKDVYPAEMVELLDQSVEITLSDQTTTYVQAFVQSMDKLIKSSSTIKPEKLNLEEIFTDIETYVRGKDRIELVEAICQDHLVHICGKDNTPENWKKYLKNGVDNLIFHEPVPFSEAIEYMRRSKIILNSTPSLKNGAHERIFSAIACGSAVLTNENPFVLENFSQGYGVETYRYQERDKARKKIDFLLSDNSRRNAMVQQGKSLVLKNHTWDQRALTLIEKLPPLIQSHFSDI